MGKDTMTKGWKVGKTGKGRNAQSYVWVNGERVSVWILEQGGRDLVNKKIVEYIENGGSIHTISADLKISPTTCKKYIECNLCDYYIIKERQNRKSLWSRNASRALKGRKSPLKGKTYMEIYGTSTPACGFARGDKNPNFTRNKFVGCTKINKYGDRFRSGYEVKFSEILKDNHIDYEFEHHMKLCNGKVKIVDFIVDNQLVEVTGYAYTKWKEDFDVKIQLLAKTYPDKYIVIVSTDDNIEELTSKHSNIASILTLSEESILSHFTNPG